MNAPRPHPTDGAREERGTSIIELLVALVILAVGILAVGQLFPAGSRGQTKDRMTTSASMYAQEKIEELSTLSWAAPVLTPGTYPAESLGTNKSWIRTYTVQQLGGSLSQVKKVTVTVSFRATGNRSVSATTYLKR